jgi:putative ABC transport system permease protein
VENACAVGLVLGLAGAALLARGLRSLIVEVVPFSPVVYLAVALAVTAMALAATAGPALRALRIDPLSALAKE